jgi:hypothetical protein
MKQRHGNQNSKEKRKPIHVPEMSARLDLQLLFLDRLNQREQEVARLIEDLMTNQSLQLTQQ